MCVSLSRKNKNNMAGNSVKYEEIEKTPVSVHDDTELTYVTRSRFTALGEEVNIVETPVLPPYTMEELNARIDEAEEQMARGEVLTEEEAELEFERFLATL